MAKKQKPLDRSDMSIYRGKKLIKPGKDDIGDTPDPKRALLWWQMEKDNDIAASITSTIQFITDHQPGRLNQLTASTRLYSNSNINGFFGGSFRSSYGQPTNSSPGSGRISFNLCSSIVDTLVAKMAKNEVMPSFITSGGIWGMQKQAEQLTKFVEGCFYANDVHSKSILAFRDGAVWGTGILHIFDLNDEVAIERVFPHELIVDEVEALQGKPQQMHRVKMVDRGLLMSMFKDDKEAVEAIRECAATTGLDMGAIGATAADLVTIKESWHLATEDEAEDGLHVISLGDTVLFKEIYTKVYFPFAFFNYSKRLIGFWGQGAVERVQNLQAEINKLMILIQKAMWMGGGFKILLENGSKVVKQHLDNEVGTIITYSNTPPQYISPPMIQSEIYPYIDALIAKGYQQEGVSQLAASSLKPQGVDSGAALRTFDSIAEDRQLFVAQELQKFSLEIARQMIEKVKEIHKRTGKYTVTYPGTMSFETIDWSDVNLKKDEYVMKAYPTSELPDEPGAKMATVQEYMQAGLITPRAGRRLLSMPDVEMSDKLANATEDLLCKIIEDILQEGIYRAPEPFYDLTLAKQLSLEYYNYADLNNCPEERLELLRQFMNQIDDLTGLNAPPLPPMATAGPAMGAPSALPQPTPTSNLVPNSANQ